jgi:ubiquinone/menaquinone biosynthesis C-methylase UbiE
MEIMKKKKWSGERLETFILTRDAVDHLHRYAIAKTYVKNKIVLDIACGEGYGSNLLREEASSVFGVDIDNETIEKAKLKYKKDNLLFQQGTTSAIPLEDNSVDVVVSFETIEHHDEHDEMMAEIKRVLKPEGITIISTPDKYYYSDDGNFKNEFHIKELYKDDFENLIRKSFSNVQLLTQKFVNGNSVVQDEESHKEIKFYNGSYLKIKEEKGIPMYLIVIASDSTFEKQSITIFNELEFARENQEILISNIRKSTTFRIGYAILTPFQFIKKLFK